MTAPVLITHIEVTLRGHLEITTPAQISFMNFSEAATGGVLRPANLLKKRLAQVLSCEFCENSKNNFLTAKVRFWLTMLCNSRNHIEINFREI